MRWEYQLGLFIMEWWYIFLFGFVYLLYSALYRRASIKQRLLVALIVTAVVFLATWYVRGRWF
jgi:uncharacterized membrane protein YagU involved in acid resistance